MTLRTGKLHPVLYKRYKRLSQPFLSTNNNKPCKSHFTVTNAVIVSAVPMALTYKAVAPCIAPVAANRKTSTSALAGFPWTTANVAAPSHPTP